MLQHCKQNHVTLAPYLHLWLLSGMNGLLEQSFTTGYLGMNFSSGMFTESVMFFMETEKGT